jgi:2C-methyl-D-erythritol 2,4-cyclodiphosphate synthase
MAEALGLDEDAVSIKATTAEGVGAAGRGECMEAYAVAQIVPLRPAGRV